MTKQDTRRIDTEGNELPVVPTDPERIARKKRMAELDAYNEPLLQRIEELEAQVTPRRIREALIDPSWMRAQDKAIAETREKLRRI